MANAFGDDASLACTGAGDNEQRPLSMGNGAALRVIELQAGVGERLEIEKSGCGSHWRS